MKRRFLLAVLLCACAHEQLVPEEAELAKEQPATQNGKPVAVKWKGELRFPPH